MGQKLRTNICVNDRYQGRVKFINTARTKVGEQDLSNRLSVLHLINCGWYNKDLRKEAVRVTLKSTLLSVKLLYVDHCGILFWHYQPGYPLCVAVLANMAFKKNMIVLFVTCIIWSFALNTITNPLYNQSPIKRLFFAQQMKKSYFSKGLFFL